jgi:HAD superfamily hydrolase (TIGR01450 family)
VPLISFEEAWRAYRDAEARLPGKPPPVSPRRVDGIADLAGQFDLVLLDSWGVLNLGDRPIPTARAAVAGLRRAGIAVRVISNDASGDKERAVANHRRRGFDFHRDEIVNGLDLLPDRLRDLDLSGQIGLIADSPAPMANVTGDMLALGDAGGAYAGVCAFVFLSADRWNEKRQILLRDSLYRNPRPIIVCNPDIASPSGTNQNAEPGFYAHRIASETAASIIFCGKPFREIYRLALAANPGIPPERVLCVGDTLHTDILGARAAGFRAMLVEDGFCTGKDALSLARESDIWPDFVAPSL